MDVPQDFVVAANGMRIHKTLVEKAKQQEKSHKARENPKGTQSNKKEELKPQASFRIESPQKNILYHAVPKQVASKMAIIPTTPEVPNKQKVAGGKKSKKNSPPQHGIRLGSFVMIENREVYRVMAKDKAGFSIHTEEGGRYIRYEDMGPLRVTKVLDMHITILKLETSNKTRIEKALMDGPNSYSLQVIVDTVQKKENYLQMKSYLVPEILDELEWEMWVAKVRNALGLKEELHVQAKQHVIKPQDFVVLVHTFFCSSNGHTMQSIEAEIVLKAFNDAELSTKRIPAGYCKQCNRYYLLSSDYDKHSLLLKQALCDFVQEGELPWYLRQRSLRLQDFSPQSILNRCGYSVSSNNALTPVERKNLLESVIEHGVLSREEVKNFLNWLIRFNGTNLKMQTALLEWNKDYQAIAHSPGAPVVLVKRVLSK